MYMNIQFISRRYIISTSSSSYNHRTVELVFTELVFTSFVNKNLQNAPKYEDVYKMYTNVYKKGIQSVYILVQSVYIFG